MMEIIFIIMLVSKQHAKLYMLFIIHCSQFCKVSIISVFGFPEIPIMNTFFNVTF